MTIRVTSTTTNIALTAHPDGTPVRVTSWVAGYQGPPGPAGADGPPGADSTVPGPAGADGVGVPAGGTTGQSLVKSSNADYATAWSTVSGGSSLGTATPLMDGTATAGVATTGSREDHRHPTDTSRAPLANPVFTGRIRLPVAGSNPANPETGDLYYSDASHAVRYYDGSGWDNLADLEDAQTFSGVKTFSANPVFNNDAIPQAKVSGLTTSLAGKAATEDVLPRYRGYIPAVGEYFSHPGNPAAGALMTLNRVYAWPLFVPVAMGIDRLAAYVGTLEATAVIRLGVYSNSAADRPADLIVDGGTFAASTTGVKEVIITATLPAGIVWMCAVAQTSAAAVKLQSYVNTGPRLPSGTNITGDYPTCRIMNSITAGLPGTWTDAGYSSNYAHVIAPRRAS